MFNRTRTTLQNACAFLEPLEVRRHLSVSVNVQGRTLVIEGDKNNNTIQVTQDGNNLLVSTDNNQQTITKRIDAIRINGRDGNDDIGVLLLQTHIHHFDIDGGGGNDLISLSLANNPDSETTAGTNNRSWWDHNNDDDRDPIEINIQGGGGVDVIALTAIITANGDSTVTTESRGSNNDWNHHDRDHRHDHDHNREDHDGFPDINVNIDAGAGDDSVDARIALLETTGTPTAQLSSGNNDNNDSDDDDESGFALGNFKVVINGAGGNDTIALGIASPDDLHNLGDNNNHHGRGWDNHRDNREFLVRVFGDNGDDDLTLNVTGELENVRRGFLIDGGRGSDTSTTNLSDQAVVIRNVEDENSTV